MATPMRMLVLTCLGCCNQSSDSSEVQGAKMLVPTGQLC